MRTVLLDSSPVGLLTHRGGIAEVDACKAMLERLIERQERVIIPEVCDYEVRRELLRIGATRSVERLDALESALEYLPLSTRAMREAARLWSHVRTKGRPTADRHALDGDTILAAQARTLDSEEIVIATSNLQHFNLLAPAVHWNTL